VGAAAQTAWPRISTKTNGERKAKTARLHFVDEGTKRVILIAASILAARELAQLGERPSPAIETCISEAIATAEKDHAED